MENNNFKTSKKSEAEGEKIEFSTINLDGSNVDRKINVCTVVDINEVFIDEFKRISNMLLAVMNSKGSKMNNSTLNMKYYEKEENLKLMLWGDTEFIKEMLDFISILMQKSDI